MLHVETVLPDTLALLKRIQAMPELSAMRLVGGTALALLLGHRKSVDLDFFGTFDQTIVFADLLRERGFQAVANGKGGSIQSLMVDGVKVDFVNYPYSWLVDPVVEDGVILAGMDDIAPMKLYAAANRGKKKDFIDMAFLLERYALSDLLESYMRKFAVSEYSYALRGLTYFDDAEDEQMPVMLAAVDWETVKRRISTAVREYLTKASAAENERGRLDAEKKAKEEGK